jgi:hypothetical protein
MAREDGVKLGSALFTMVEPRPGHEVAYNRWYERDHFYAGCMIGPWLFAGRRFVAVKPLKDLRYPSESPIASPSTLGSYIAVYWILADKLGEHNEWAVRQVNWLHANGRMFLERDHISTALYELLGAVDRDPDGVPPELALDHSQYQGLVVVWTDKSDGVGLDEFRGWLHTEVFPGLLAGSPIAQVLTWTPVPLSDDRPADVPQTPGLGERLLHAFFLECDPREVWDARFNGLGDTLAASGRGTVALAAPFIPTIVGTDTYTDQLW